MSNLVLIAHHKCFKTVFFLQLKRVDIETVADQCEEKSTEQGTDEGVDELVVDSQEVVDSAHGSEGVDVEDDMTQLLLLGKFEYTGGPVFKVVLEC